MTRSTPTRSSNQPHALSNKRCDREEPQRRIWTLGFFFFYRERLQEKHPVTTETNGRAETNMNVLTFAVTVVEGGTGFGVSAGVYRQQTVTKSLSNKNEGCVVLLSASTLGFINSIIAVVPKPRGRGPPGGHGYYDILITIFS